MPLFTAANVSGDTKGLKEDFINPPRQYSLLPFWAWNDTLESERLKWQIDQMVDKNVFGAFMHARVGLDESETPYFSEGFWDAVNTAITYGKQVGFNPWLYDEDKWPSGSAGGRTIKVNPEEFLQKGLAYSAMEIEGPQKIKLQAAEKVIAVIAAKFTSRDVISEKSLADISEFAGQSWDVPEGRWLVMSFSQITEAQAQSGPQRGIDYLDKEAVAAFIKITHEEYYKRFGKYFGNVVPGIFFDEITAKLTRADFAWTDDFLEQFSRIKGYDLKKYLPLLVYDGGDITAKIRCDYYDVFTTLYVQAWAEQISKWCSDHNILLTGHTYEDIYSFITQGDYFRTFAPVQIPMADNEDFRYSFPAYIEWFKPKQLASISHLNGRQLAGVEALGGSGWFYTLEELRYGLSMLAVYGMNFMVLHGFYYTIDTPATSSDFPPSWFYQNPHWKYFGQVGKFAQRILYMGRQGRHVCDTAILYPITSQWTSGRREGGLGKKYTIEELNDILSLQYYNVQKILLDNQIDYDVIDPASLLRADVSSGKMEIAEEKYSVLILPPLSVIKRDVLEKIKSFYENGGTIIALNTLPTSSMEEGANDAVIIKGISDIFGFNPFFIRSGYFEIDETYSHKYITSTNSKNGKAYFTKEAETVPSIVENSVGKDIVIREGDPGGFNFLHKATADCDIYYIVNGQKLPRQWTVSFRSTGAAEKWYPETGRIEQLYSCGEDKGRTEMSLSFRPWESCYIVFDKSAESSSTRKPAEKQKDSASLKPIELVGEWEFIPVGRSLDYKWEPTVAGSQIKLPVMDFSPEKVAGSIKINELLLPQCENIYWKQVKIKDIASKITGCGRYLSAWDGWWITYAQLKPHWGAIGGKEIKFAKKVDISGSVKEAWMCITADKKYELYINEKKVGEDTDWKNAETYDIASYLKAGENLFGVAVKDAGALLLEGKITLADGKDIKVVSDRTWQACDEAGIWSSAFEYVNPPLGPWGNIELKKEALSFPVEIWYRQELPVGTVGMMMPVIKGDYQVFVNGRAVELKPDQERIDFGKLPNKQKNVLLVKVKVKDYSEGIIEPITVICEPAKVNLTSWQDYGLDWYSGRCAYSKDFEVPNEYLTADTRLVLDLGDVRYFVEVWVNDKLAGVRIWPPYEPEIGDYLVPGKNRVNLVVANLITNEMRWNIFDESLTNLHARWGHDLGILRRPDILNSGITGPVRIIPFKKTASDGIISD